MPYLVKGNAAQLFSAFDQSELISAVASDTGRVLNVDLGRTSFLGSASQATELFSSWVRNVAAQYYTQGNISGDILRCLLGLSPLKKEDELPEQYYEHFMHQAFAYLNNEQQACGFMVIYRRDNPAQWMFGHIKNTAAEPKNREITLLASFDLKSYITKPEFGVVVTHTPLHDNPLIRQLGSPILVTLMQHLFVDGSSINKHFDRLSFVLRNVVRGEQAMLLKDPVNYSEINFAQLFADNIVLDMLQQHSILPSSAVLKDCISIESKLYKELQKIALTDNSRIKRNLIQMTLVFYEENLLEENRIVLRNHSLIESLRQFMWDREQIKLVPFMVNKKYSLDLMQKILNDAIYYETLNRVVELNLTQDVLSLFDDPKKLNELKELVDLPEFQFANEGSKKLCLIFWIKDSLTIDAYKEIILQTKKYPLMASTLIALDKAGVVLDGIQGLRADAFNPATHLKASIRHHFFSRNSIKLGLSKLDVSQLQAASEALSLLKETKVENIQRYYLIIRDDNRGKILRIFLPQIAKMSDCSTREKLIDILYTGVTLGVAIQGKELLKIQDKKQLILAKNLYEQFSAVTQLQGLEFADSVVFWAAQNTQHAQYLRQIVSQVEEQCKKISTRLASSVSYKKMRSEWEKLEANYRKTLYSLAYESLKSPGVNLKQAIEHLISLENEILKQIDPPVHSSIYRAIIFIANIFITTLTLGLANYIKNQKTGNYWFFNQTVSGEEIRKLRKEVFTLINREAMTQETHLNTNSPI